MTLISSVDSWEEDDSSSGLSTSAEGGFSGTENKRTRRKKGKESDYGKLCQNTLFENPHSPEQ